mgnify:CR=1 FL=1
MFITFCNVSHYTASFVKECGNDSAIAALSTGNAAIAALPNGIMKVTNAESAEYEESGALL